MATAVRKRRKISGVSGNQEGIMVQTKTKAGRPQKTRFGLTKTQWENAKAQAFAVLQEVAHRRGLITYGDLARRITAYPLEAHNFALHWIIGELSKDEYANNRGMISALVVHKYGDMEPGGGFYDLAHDLGIKTRDRLVLWVEEVKKVHAVWQ